MVERFPEVARRDADGRGDLGGLFGSEDALARRGQTPDKLDPALSSAPDRSSPWIVFQ